MVFGFHGIRKQLVVITRASNLQTEVFIGKAPVLAPSQEDVIRILPLNVMRDALKRHSGRAEALYQLLKQKMSSVRGCGALKSVVGMYHRYNLQQRSRLRAAPCTEQNLSVRGS